MLVRLRILLVFAILVSFAFSPAISFAQKKTAAKKSSGADDEFDSLDGEDDELEKELQQIESEEFKDLDTVQATPAPEVELPPEEPPAQAEAPAEEPELLTEEPIEEPGIEAPAPAPKKGPMSPLPKKKAQAKPEPPPPEIQEEPVPEPVVEQPPEPEPIPEPAIEPPAPEPIVETRPAAPVDDSPDTALEARMQSIYQKFYSQKTSDEEWSGVVGDRVSETYMVQKGDTLWGISVTFFGNGFFWPKLWQLNSEGITNPHEINVGDKIVFSMGTLGREPEVRVAREADQEFIVKETVGSEAPQSVKVPGRRRFRDVLESLPPSLPEIIIEESAYDSSGFAITAVRSPKIPDPFPLVSLLTDAPPPVDGEIVEVETGGKTAAILQQVFVKLKRGGVGDIFSAFIVRKSLGGGVIFGGGLPIEYQGELEIIEQVEGRLYKAIIISNFDQIDVGARLTSGPIPEGDNSPTGRAKSIEASVLGGPMDDNRYLFGLHSIVYLDGGAQKGIEVGDLLTVLKNDALRTESELNVKMTNPIGKIKILNVSRKFATGVVVESDEEIRPGDRTGRVSE